MSASCRRFPREAPVRRERLGTSSVYGHPPKVIWLRLGNCSGKRIETLLRRRAVEVGGFLADERKALLVLS